MATIGKVESLWRYPVKSMRGEELNEAFVGFAGVYGDRLFAFRSAVRPTGFPYLTGREQMKMVLYRPRFRYPDKAAKPPNLAEVGTGDDGLSSGLVVRGPDRTPAQRGAGDRPRQAALQGECFHGPRVHSGVRGGRLCWSDAAHGTLAAVLVFWGVW